jgi:hypothetical protein
VANSCQVKDTIVNMGMIVMKCMVKCYYKWAFIIIVDIVISYNMITGCYKVIINTMVIVKTINYIVIMYYLLISFLIMDS